MKPLDYAILAADTMMATYAAEDLPPYHRFHYHQGFFLSGMEKLYLQTRDEKYYDYIKKWVDYNVYPDGTIRFQHRDQFDDFQPARLLFYLYKATGDAHYKAVLDRLIGYIGEWPKTPDGGFWHMETTPEQMWLDGLYMAGCLLGPYAKEFNRPELFDVIHEQMMLMWKHHRDPKTGLMYHAWDYSKKESWADPETGCSPHFWGRAMGWVVLVIADTLDLLPEDYPKRDDFVMVLTGLLESLAKYQSKDSGLWFQVVDMPGRAGNWAETSCSAFYTYGFCKAVRKGYLGREYLENAKRGYQGLAEAVYVKDGRLELPAVCVGTCVGDYEFYVNRPRTVNDLHGMGIFIMAMLEYNELMKEQ